MPTPAGHFTGKTFEERIIDAAKTLKTRKILLMARYGTQSAFGAAGARAIQSLPDFEGVTSWGVQFLCEAKTVQTDLLPIHSKFIKKRQITHMVERADFSVPSFILCLHRGRELKTKTVPSDTRVYPVHRKMPWVQECLLAYKEKREPVGSIPEDMGFSIDWFLPPNAKRSRPDLVTAIEKSRQIIVNLNAQ